MKVVKKITNIATIVFAILATVCGVVGAIIGGKEIASALLPSNLIQPITALFTDFSVGALKEAIVPIILILFIALFVLAAITWLVIAIVCKRPVQILVVLPVSILGILALDMIVVNLGGLIEVFAKAIKAIIAGGALPEALAGLKDLLKLETLALFMGLIGALAFLAAVIFNIVWLFQSLKDYEYQNNVKKHELLIEHRKFIVEFRKRVEEAQATVDELTAFVKKDDGHAAYLRTDLANARRALRDAKRALEAAEKKYITAKAKNDKDNKVEKELNEKLRIANKERATQKRKEDAERIAALELERKQSIEDREIELKRIEEEIRKQRAQLAKEIELAELTEKEYQLKLAEEKARLAKEKEEEQKAPAIKPVKKATKKVAKKPVQKMPVKKMVEVKKAPAKKPAAKKPAVKKPEVVPAPVVVPEKRERVSFEDRLNNADKGIKVIYNDLKNELLAYGVKSRVSSSGDTFRLHTKTYVKMVVAGKSLKLYMALNPADYKDSPMPIGDASKKNLYKEIPLVFKVKSDLSVRRAKQLIAETMAKDNIPQGPVEKVTWIK